MFLPWVDPLALAAGPLSPISRCAVQSNCNWPPRSKSRAAQEDPDLEQQFYNCLMFNITRELHSPPFSPPFSPEHVQPKKKIKDRYVWPSPAFPSLFYDKVRITCSLLYTSFITRKLLSIFIDTSQTKSSPGKWHGFTWMDCIDQIQLVWIQYRQPSEAYFALPSASATLNFVNCRVLLNGCLSTTLTNNHGWSVSCLQALQPAPWST